MKLPGAPRSTQLTYCTNIHPGERWDEVRDALERHVRAVKARVAPEQSFGVGLRLSARAAGELAAGGALAELKRFLDDAGMHVFTINGFPHGAFHGTAVKERVYLPDWRDDERRRYSDELAALLAELLPDGMDGSVSTVPGAYASEVAGDPAVVGAMSEQMVQHAAALAKLEARTGKRVALAVEPEPCCHIETIEQAVAFFGEHLHGDAAAVRVAELCATNSQRATGLLRRHLGLCLDACHAAVEFEDARAGVAALRAAGIAVYKLQLSAGLRIERADADARAALEPYLDDVYLHQVVARATDGRLTRYGDLPEALATPVAEGEPEEWRVHFHVPVFLERLPAFGSTQAFLGELLSLQQAEPISQHLEVETYTWDVLPEEARTVPLEDAIARELRWCMARLGAAPASR